MSSGQTPTRRKTGIEALDPCVVPTAPLCGIVRDFVEGWLRERRSTRGQFGDEPTGDVTPVSPYEHLAFDSGLPEKEIRKIRNPRRYPLTELRFADALLASIGTPEMFHDGLEPQPNPLVADGHGECCSGSTTNTIAGHLTRGAIIRAGDARVLGPARPI